MFTFGPPSQSNLYLMFVDEPPDPSIFGAPCRPQTPQIMDCERIPASECVAKAELQLQNQDPPCFLGVSPQTPPRLWIANEFHGATAPQVAGGSVYVSERRSAPGTDPAPGTDRRVHTHISDYRLLDLHP